jgi:glycosyltransferase involved in cell wall biosynthesis
LTVAAIIPTLIERRDMAKRAVGSVIAQVQPVDQIVVRLDAARDGPAVTRNRAVGCCDTEWLAFLDDDDEWLPRHVETLVANSGGADVVYTDCEVRGEHTNDLVVNIDFDPFRLLRFNFIPVTTLVRRSAFLEAGGFDPADRYEDWELWKRLARLGAAFTHVPETTWVYRFHSRDQRTFEES